MSQTVSQTPDVSPDIRLSQTSDPCQRHPKCKWGPLGLGPMGPMWALCVPWVAINHACVEVCPISIDPLSIIMDMRQFLIMEESSAHPDLNNMMNNIENNGAPWPYNQQDRELWIQES